MFFCVFAFFLGEKIFEKVLCLNSSSFPKRNVFSTNSSFCWPCIWWRGMRSLCCYVGCGSNAGQLDEFGSDCFSFSGCMCKAQPHGLLSSLSQTGQRCCRCGEKVARFCLQRVKKERKKKTFVLRFVFIFSLFFFVAAINILAKLHVPCCSKFALCRVANKTMFRNRFTLHLVQMCLLRCAQRGSRSRTLEPALFGGALLRAIFSSRALETQQHTPREDGLA